MTTRLIIFNRAPADPQNGWIHIVPKGELPNTAAGIVQVLDDPALDSILAGIQQEQKRLGAKWPGVYAGREHFIYDPDKDSEALAWFKDFQKRDDGLWANADGLTDLGTEAVQNRHYKFTSFVADPEDLEPLDGKSSSSSSSSSLPRYRILAIETIGFTNQANGKELLTPITNRASKVARASCPFDSDSLPNFETHGRDARATSTKPPVSGFARTGQPHNKGPQMKSVCNLLGLSAEADEPAVYAAVSKLLNRGDIAPDALATLRAGNLNLTEQNQLLLAEQSETLLDACAVKDERVRNRLKDGLKLLKNRPDRLSYLADFGYAPGESAANSRGAATGRVLNRGVGASAARETFTSGYADNEQALALKIQNRAGELQAKGLKYDTAWNQARRELIIK